MTKNNKTFVGKYWALGVEWWSQQLFDIIYVRSSILKGAISIISSKCVYNPSYGLHGPFLRHFLFSQSMFHYSIIY